MRRVARTTAREPQRPQRNPVLGRSILLPMPLWLSVVLVVVAVTLLMGLVAFLINKLNQN
jgi:hypothetical protein